MKKNKDFLDFIIGKDAPPAQLSSLTKKDILLGFHAKSIMLKFLGLQLLGALFSLSVCPQYGIGLVEGHGITHIFRMIGDWACAAFCGSFFLTVGMLVAFLGMKGEELWWVWRRYKFPLIFLPAFFWSALMLTNMSFNLSSETATYHLVWIVTAIMVQALLFELRSWTHQGFNG